MMHTILKIKRKKNFILKPKCDVTELKRDVTEESKTAIFVTNILDRNMEIFEKNEMNHEIYASNNDKQLYMYEMTY